MKNLLFSIAFLASLSSSFGQNIFNNEIAELEDNLKYTSTNNIGNNGFYYSTKKAGKANSKFSEFGSGFFKNKFIMVSSKKIGGLAKKDQKTGEGFSNIFCLDIKQDGDLKMPLLFSRIINTPNNNEGQVSFSPDEETMYFTRSTKENSLIYKLYKTKLKKRSHGKWIAQEFLSVNRKGASVENPYVSKDGKKLYFSSNRIGGFGGYDLYVATINEDGTLGKAKNLGEVVNTKYDEKFPSLSVNDNTLYFSSKGHNSIGGFDIYKSNIIEANYETPKNLGNTINTKNDEVAYFMASLNKGYFSSNKFSNKGAFNIYAFDFDFEEHPKNIENTIVQTKK